MRYCFIIGYYYLLAAIIKRVDSVSSFSFPAKTHNEKESNVMPCCRFLVLVLFVFLRLCCVVVHFFFLVLLEDQFLKI